MRYQRWLVVALMFMICVTMTGCTLFGMTIGSNEGDSSPATYEEDTEAVYADGSIINGDSALDAAEKYLTFMSFSRRELTEQLEYEGFSNADAKYAVENCSADWFDQATGKAELYMTEVGGFSYKTMVDQLKHDGFTSFEAEHGAKHVGLAN